MIKNAQLCLNPNSIIENSFCPYHKLKGVNLPRLEERSLAVKDHSSFLWSSSSGLSGQTTVIGHTQFMLIRTLKLTTILKCSYGQMRESKEKIGYQSEMPPLEKVRK